MSQILLVNPSKRGKRSKSRKRKNPVKRRTAKQKAATRKLVALNRRRRNPTRRKNTVKRRTKRRTTARRKSPVRRRATTRRRSARRRSNPALNMRSVTNQLKEAGTGAVGAIALDIAQGYLPIPANLKTGLIGTATKAGLAIGIGIIASKLKFVNYSTAAKMANGALTVVLHDALKEQIVQYAPGIQMGEYLSGYEGAGMNPYDDTPMGSYLPATSMDPFSIDPLSMDMGEYLDASHEDEMNY